MVNSIITAIGNSSILKAIFVIFSLFFAVIKAFCKAESRVIKAVFSGPTLSEFVAEFKAAIAEYEADISNIISNIGVSSAAIEEVEEEIQRADFVTNYFLIRGLDEPEELSVSQQWKIFCAYESLPSSYCK